MQNISILFASDVTAILLYSMNKKLEISKTYYWEGFKK